MKNLGTAIIAGAALEGNYAGVVDDQCLMNKADASALHAKTPQDPFGEMKRPAQPVDGSQNNILDSVNYIDAIGLESQGPTEMMMSGRSKVSKVSQENT